MEAAQPRPVHPAVYEEAVRAAGLTKGNAAEAFLERATKPATDSRLKQKASSPSCCDGLCRGIARDTALVLKAALKIIADFVIEQCERRSC